MNEISKQIIELGKLIGKKVFVKHYIKEYDAYFSDSDVADVFTVDDFENYSYGVLDGKISLMDITYKTKFGKYYLIRFEDFL